MPSRSSRRVTAVVTACTLAASLLPVLAAPVAALSPVVVTTLGTAVANDGECTLPEAIDAVNRIGKSGTAAGECDATSGTGRITFAVRGTITPSDALPDVQADLSIEAEGITIDWNSLDGSIAVAPGVHASIDGLTLTGSSGASVGGIDASGWVRLTRVRIEGNSATAAGGIRVADGGTLWLIDSVVTDNHAADGGGLSLGAGSTVRILRSEISHNTATGSGGGIRSRATTLVTYATTIAENSAADGGGISAAAGGLTLTSTTVALNTATAGTGGASIDPVVGAQLLNTIVAANPGTSGQQVTSADFVSASLVAADGAGLLDPAGLRDNGGPTRTVAILSSAAAAVDQGSDDFCQLAPVNGLDQRGVTRPAGACDIGAVELETAPPSATAPRAELRTGQALSGSAAAARLTWSGADGAGGSGVATYRVERSVDGGTFALLEAAEAGTSFDVTLSPGTTYRFRVTPTDHDGNTGGPVTSAQIGTKLTQQTAAAITYAKSWTTQSDSAFSGGSVRFAKKAGASASLRFTGRGIAFVTTTGPNRGKARVYINGSLEATIDLGGSAATRVQAWSVTFPTSATRTIKVVVVGTSGRPRVDVDAFVVLK